MTAGPFLADEVFKRACPRWRDNLGKHFPSKIRRRFEVAIIFIGVFYAGYAAFKEEHAARETAEAALRNATPAPVQFQVTETDVQARANGARTQSELAETKKKLARANEEIGQLRARVEDRTIGADSKQKLIETLKNSPKGTVIVEADWTDGEAQQFANEITEILRVAGFTLLKANTEVLALNSKGVFLFIADPATPPVHAQPILSALEAAGVPIKGEIATSGMRHLRNGDISKPRELESGELIIWIARKP
jgi:hypothetical protein